MPLLDIHYTSSLTYRTGCNRLKQGKKPFNAQFLILHDEKTHLLCGNESLSRLKVAIQTHPHSEQRCIMSWGLMLSPPYGLSATNLMNCLLIALKRLHRNLYCVVPNLFYIFETTEILIVLDVVCKVGKSLETPSNVIL